MVAEKWCNLSEQQVEFPREKEVKPVKPIYMNIYQSNIYRKNLSWMHFVNEPSAQDREHVKDQQSYIPVFEVYLTIPSSNFEYQPRCDITIPCIGVW